MRGHNGVERLYTVILGVLRPCAIEYCTLVPFERRIGLGLLNRGSGGNDGFGQLIHGKLKIIVECGLAHDPFNGLKKRNGAHVFLLDVTSDCHALAVGGFIDIVVARIDQTLSYVLSTTRISLIDQLT